MKPEVDFDIRLSNVKVTLPNQRRLFAVSDYSIPFGEHVLIQGESGLGKTTFLHLIAGLFLPKDGHIAIGSRNLALLSDNERCDLRLASIGVIFQKLNLMDHLTVAENVSLALPRKSANQEEKVRQAISRVRLEGRGGDRCSLLSLGEQQRVAVARVLAQAPNIILADEPTSSLDEMNANFVMDALEESAKGKTLIVVSHDHRLSKKFEKVVRFEEFLK